MFLEDDMDGGYEFMSVKNRGVKCVELFNRQVVDGAANTLV